MKRTVAPRRVRFVLTPVRRPVAECRGTHRAGGGGRALRRLPRRRGGDHSSAERSGSQRPGDVGGRRGTGVGVAGSCPQVGDLRVARDGGRSPERGREVVEVGIARGASAWSAMNRLARPRAHRPVYARVSGGLGESGVGECRPVGRVGACLLREQVRGPDLRRDRAARPSPSRTPAAVVNPPPATTGTSTAASDRGDQLEQRRLVRVGLRGPTCLGDHPRPGPGPPATRRRARLPPGPRRPR